MSPSILSCVLPLVLATLAAAQGPELRLEGDRRVGGTLRLVLQAQPGDAAFLAISSVALDAPRATPFGDLYLSQPERVLRASVPASGMLVHDVALGLDPALAAQRIYAQGLTLAGGSTPLVATSIGAADVPPPQQFRVLVLNYDPILEVHGGQRLHEFAGWNDPRALYDQYVDELRQLSGGWLDLELAEWVDVDEYPLKEDGFRYTDDTYLAALASGMGWHSPDTARYARIFNDFDIPARVSARDFDEVFLFGAPYFGYYESRMAGPGAYWVNAPPMPSVPSTRPFLVMGFNYERTHDLMLHSYGHRVESIMTHVYGSWNNQGPAQHDWDRFSRYDAIDPGNAGIGNIHFPANGSADYDYANPAVVLSTARDWRTRWPALSGSSAPVSSADWGASQLGYMRFFYAHLPRREGQLADTREASWWRYVQDPGSYPHSR